MWIITKNLRTGVVEYEQSFSDRPVALEPRRPRGKGQLMKLTLTEQVNRKGLPRRKASKVICYRLKERS